MRTRLVVLALVLWGIAAAAVFAYSGLYNVAATEQHTAPVYWALEWGMRRSVTRHARGIQPPRLDDSTLVRRGLVLYNAHCLQCHGAPGQAPQTYALGLTPVPANLAHVAREWRPEELFWIVKHGIKMSGMPAWEFRLTENEIWAVVAFVRKLPALSPADYASLRDLPPQRDGEPADVSAPPRTIDVNRGKAALQQYACVTCHDIPGVVGAYAPVGPPLGGIAARKLIAGNLANTPENMIRWLRSPPSVNPVTAMPDLGVTERDARDIAEFLATLK